MKTENDEKIYKLPTPIRIGISICTLVTILIAFNQCTFDKKTNKKVTKKENIRFPATSGSNFAKDASDIESDVELPEGLVMPPANSPSEVSDLDEIDVGVKNFEQIYLSMAALTGVNTAETATMNLYKELTVQLPADNNIKSFLPANQVAITKLAAEFCEKLVETQNLRVVIWPTFNFNLTPIQAFASGSTNKQMVITQAIDRFIPPSDSATRIQTNGELTKLFDELLPGENLGSSVTTRTMVKAMCISTLASAHTTLL